MNSKDYFYIPCLCWKKGECGAVDALPDEVKSRLLPLLEPKEIGFQYDERKPVPTIDAHLTKFVNNVSRFWGTGRCIVDTNRIEADARMCDGTHPLTLVLGQLRSRNCLPVPATGFHQDDAHQEAIIQFNKSCDFGACFRIGIRHAVLPTFATMLNDLSTRLNLKPENCDLVIDLIEAKDFEPIQDFAELLAGVARSVPDLNRWRSFTMIGTSIPQSMSEVNKGLSWLPRFEWLLYKQLVKRFKDAGIRVPAFGDYAITYPGILELDPAKLTTGAKIKYTVDDAWVIIKGESLKSAGSQQFNKLSNMLMHSGYFLGRSFSAGDAFIVDKACGLGKGNLTQWVEAGTNHHITKIMADLASFYGVSSNSSP